MKAKRELKFGSLFTCGGGSSIGATKAGMKELFACDINPNARDAFEANRHIFGEAPYLNKDVRTVTPEELLTVSGLKLGELDLLEASPPCKFISRTNPLARWNHPMNFLYRHVFKHMVPTALYPKVVVMENVAALYDPSFRPLLEKILFDASRLNYHFRFEILDAMDFGVPQSRERIIFIFVRKDIGSPVIFPKPLDRHIPIKDVIHGIIGFKDINFGSPFRLGTDICCTLTTAETLKFHFVEGERNATVEERRAIMTFPGAYNLPNKKTAALELLGNAVPPMLMFHIISAIKSHVLTPYYKKQSIGR